MCRNIKTLFNFEPPVTDAEVRAASFTFEGLLKPLSLRTNCSEAAFELAVERTAEVAHGLLHSLVTNAAPRDREAESAKARVRAAARFHSHERP